MSILKSKNSHVIALLRNRVDGLIGQIIIYLPVLFHIFTCVLENIFVCSLPLS